ncbi:hypothetical protein Nepgr_029250 [Nepenthes gracilis]|uniref:Pollen Ole e 1 allergen and extensin family protein n=1 Tax=Nepenthes gracilis TaxID=150966 RepID=A0AAD3TF14_NEPGR|nr:hypothetical protein Nepgr_029250 [Nepenthes gracilis]
MDIVPLSLLAALFAQALSLLAQPHQATATSSNFTVVGAVYCDTCFDNVFSRHSYFLPGVDVHIQCKFMANFPRTTESISFSVNRTTDKYGLYKLEMPSVDGVDCTDGPAIHSSCQATLISSSSSACNIPALKATAYEISVKSKQSNLCIYSFTAMSFRPMERNHTLCGKPTEELPTFNSTKFLLPHGFPWSHLPLLPPLPKLPIPPLTPFPSFQYPPFPYARPPSLPFSFPNPPSLPFPFSPLPPFRWAPLLLPPPPPSPTFNLGDPRTWIPNIPLFSSPPPSPQPTFNPWDPRTWIPFPPPSPPTSPQNQHP